MKKLLIILFISLGLIGSANASTLCPNGTYVSGNICTLCPNGQYVGGTSCVLAPDGTYVSGSSSNNSFTTDLGQGAGWNAMTQSAFDSGNSIGKAFSNTYSGENLENDAIDKIYNKLMNTGNAKIFKAPINSSGTWDEVARNNLGSVFFIDPNTILSGNDDIFWWELVNYNKADPFGTMSVKAYKQGDCKANRYKDLTYGFYKKPMGRNNLKTVNRPDKEWNYTKAGTVNGFILETVCQLIEEKKKPDTSNEIKLKCIPDEYPKEGTNEEFDDAVYEKYVSKFNELKANGGKGLGILNNSYQSFKNKRVQYENNMASELLLNIYPNSKLFLRPKIDSEISSYKESSDFILFTTYSKIVGFEYMEKWDYSLNRVTGEVIESVSFLAGSSNEYAHKLPRTYQCVRADGLF